MDTLERIKELAAKQFGGEPDAIAPDVPVNSLGADSLGFLEFLFELEDDFGVPIPEKDAEQVKTLRELSVLIDRLLEEAKTPKAS
jgi:acyl carrier protein